MLRLGLLTIVVPQITFETDNEAAELAGFQDRSQAVISNTSLYNNTPGGTATNSQLLTGESGNIFGISKFLPIQAGDKVSMEVFGKYSTTATANSYDFAANLVGNLLNQLPLTPAELQAAGLQSSISNDFATVGRSGLSNADGVSAYLNYILLDETFTFVSAGYQMLPDNADASHQQLAMELIPEQDGYVYIYLTNESQQLTDVYFDDFKVTHEVLIKDPQLEAYRYGFNGKEKDSKGEFGLNHYDYGFRIYNPAIAKFLSVDPLTKSYPMLTPYQFASNRPIDGIDLDGLEYWNSTTMVYGELSGNIGIGYGFAGAIKVGKAYDMIGRTMFILGTALNPFNQDLYEESDNPKLIIGGDISLGLGFEIIREPTFAGAERAKSFSVPLEIDAKAGTGFSLAVSDRTFGLNWGLGIGAGFKSGDQDDPIISISLTKEEDKSLAFGENWFGAIGDHVEILDDEGRVIGFSANLRVRTRDSTNEKVRKSNIVIYSGATTNSDGEIVSDRSWKSKAYEEEERKYN